MSSTPTTGARSGYTIKAIDEMESIHHGAVKLAGAELGVRVLRDPGTRVPAAASPTTPSTTTPTRARKRSIVFLRGSGEFEIDGERVPVRAPGRWSGSRPRAGANCGRAPRGRSSSPSGARPTVAYERPDDFRLAEQRMSAEMAASSAAEPCVVTGGENLWFLGTLARMKLEGRQTGGRFGLWEGVFPHGAAPPLHSHPQDETFYILDGELTAWLVEPELVAERSRTDALPAGSAPAGAAFRARWSSRPAERRIPSGWSPTPHGCSSSRRLPGSRTSSAAWPNRRGGRGCNRRRTVLASRAIAWPGSSARPGWSATGLHRLHRLRLERARLGQAAEVAVDVGAGAVGRGAVVAPNR